MIRFLLLMSVLLACTPLYSQAETPPSLAMGVFAVSPAKQEVRVAAGDSIIRNIYITNRLGRDAEFDISIEDVSGGNDSSVRFYGDGLGPYSIKKFAFAGNERIRIANGEVKVVPIMITVPVKTKPGGYYGVVFVKELKNESGNAKISTRAGSLIFLRVSGEVIEIGELKNFSTGQFIFWNRKPIEFQVSYGNRGNIYLNPYGLIEVRNYRDRVIDKIPIDPWFVFPDSVRTRGFVWKNVPWFGSYKATVYLNHGYGSPKTTVESVRFLVLPIKLFIIIFIILLIGLGVYRFRDKLKKWQV